MKWRQLDSYDAIARLHKMLNTHISAILLAFPAYNSVDFSEREDIAGL